MNIWIFIMKNGLYINSYGSKFWYKNRQVHRMNSPAIIYPHNIRFWYLNDKQHSIREPAYNMYGRVEWWTNGNCLDEHLYLYCHTNNIDIKDYRNLPISDRLKLKIKFGLQL